MAKREISVFLNAVDNTSSATASAANNIASYTDSIVASSDQASAAIAGIGQQASAGMDFSGIAASLSGLISPAAMVATAIAGIGGAAYLIYQNWESIGPFLSGVMESIGTAVSEAVAWIWEGLSSIGSMVASVASSLFESATGLLGEVTSVLGSFWESVKGGIENIIGNTLSFGNVLEWLKTMGYATLATLEFAWNNLGAVADLAFTSIAYGAVKTWNQLEWMLTEAIPTTAIWLWENLNDILLTAGDFLAATLTNAWENLKNFFTAVWSWLSGDGFDFKWTALTKGFESSIKELPQILEREVGTIEAALGREVDKLQGQLGKGLADHIAARLGDIPAFNEDIKKGLTGAVNGVKGLAGRTFDTIGGFGSMGGRGQQQQIALAEGDSSRFLSGSTAAAQEQLMREQIETQRRMEQEQKAQTSVLNAIRGVVGNDVVNAVKAGQAAKVVING